MDTRSECRKLYVLAPFVEILARYHRALPTIFPLRVLPKGNCAKNDQNRVLKEKRIVLHSPGNLRRDQMLHISKAATVATMAIIKMELFREVTWVTLLDRNEGALLRDHFLGESVALVVQRALYSLSR